MVTDENGIERFSMEKDLWDFCQRAKQKIHTEDTQVLGVIYGQVGCGKSVLAQHIGYAIDPTLETSRICFTKDEFMRAVVKSRKQVIIADEGIAIFFSRAAMTKDSRLISEFMAQIRQKNLCILICVPNLLTVDNIVLEATDFCCEVTEIPSMINGRKVQTKGNASFWIEKIKKGVKNQVYYLRKNRNPTFKHMKGPRPVFRVRGNPVGESFKAPWYPTGEESYRKKKESVLDKYIGDDGELSLDKVRQKPISRRDIKNKTLIDTNNRLKASHPELNQRQRAEILGIHTDTLRKWEYMSPNS